MMDEFPEPERPEITPHELLDILVDLSVECLHSKSVSAIEFIGAMETVKNMFMLSLESEKNGDSSDRGDSGG